METKIFKKEENPIQIKPTPKSTQTSMKISSIRLPNLSHNSQPIHYISTSSSTHGPLYNHSRSIKNAQNASSIERSSIPTILQHPKNVNLSRPQSKAESSITKPYRSHMMNPKNKSKDLYHNLQKTKINKKRGSSKISFSSSSSSSSLGKRKINSDKLIFKNKKMISIENSVVNLAIENKIITNPHLLSSNNDKNNKTPISFSSSPNLKVEKKNLTKNENIILLDDSNTFSKKNDSSRIKNNTNDDNEIMNID